MKLACQIAILFLLALRFIAGVWVSVHGKREVIEPTGFPGVLIDVIALAGGIAFYWAAGALTEVVR